MQSLTRLSAAVIATLLFALPVSALPTTSVALPTLDVRTVMGLAGVDGRGVPLPPTQVAASLGQAISDEWGAAAIGTSPAIIHTAPGTTDADPLATPEDESGASGTAAYAGRLLYDATGDGLDDVGGYQENLDTGEVSLFVWDGANGEPVFTTDAFPDDAIYSFTVFVAGDRSGDGIDDLIELRLVTVDTDGECDETADGYNCTFDERFTWSVDLISGATGQRLHSRTQDGYYRGYDRGNEEGYAYQIEASNLFPLPVPSADHDRDGIADLIVQDELVFVQGSDSEPQKLDVDTTASVLNAAWLPIATFTATDRPAYPTLQAAGDLTGDGMPDLLWATAVDLGERTEEDCTLGLPAGLEALLGLCSTRTYWASAVRLEIVDGSDFATVGDMTVEDSDSSFFYAYPVGDQDIDDDGIADLRLATLDWESTELIRLDAFSGEVVWGYSTPHVVGAGVPMDIDGDGATELALRGTLTSSVSGPQGKSTTATFFQTVLDGATGAVESSESVTESRDYAANAFGFVFGAPQAVDLNADGIADPIFQDMFGVYDPDDGSVRMESILRVLDATDISRALLVRDGDTARFFTEIAVATPEATPSLLEIDYGPDFGEEPSARVIDGAAGTVARLLEGIDWVSTLPSADGSDDLLVTDVTEIVGHVSTTVARQDLSTTATIWSRLAG